MIYLIKSTDYIKVGFSINFKNRLSAYYTSNPSFEVLDTYEEGSETDEKALHQQLAKYKYNNGHANEWFHAKPEVIIIWNQYTKHNLIVDLNADPFLKIIEHQQNEIKNLQTNMSLLEYSKQHVINNAKLFIENNNIDGLITYIKKEYNGLSIEQQLQDQVNTLMGMVNQALEAAMIHRNKYKKLAEYVNQLNIN